MARAHCLAILVVSLLLAPGLARSLQADDWLVYLGGGLEPIEGGWEKRHGQIVFTKVGGTLVSVPYSDVDLATSAFLTWQLNGRTEAPPRGPVPPAAGLEGDTGETCVEALVGRLVDSETLEVATADGPETVHIACLDAPDTRHRFAELGWFGRVTLRAAELEVRRGDRVCIAEHSPPQRDRQGHRIVHVTLPGGKDYSSEVIAAGLGLLRLGACDRAAEYRVLEDGAIAGERGLWGPSGAKAAFAAASNSLAVGAGGTGAAPPRRVGGG